MIDQVQPKLVITTGTAGGIGADVLLGDVIVSRHVRWDATLRFPEAPFAHQAYTSTAKLHPGQFHTAVRTLIPVNAKHLPAEHWIYLRNEPDRGQRSRRCGFGSRGHEGPG